MKSTDILTEILKERILVLDGAMGTVLQEYGLEETDYRGKRFSDHHTALKGNNDILSLSCPDTIKCIHERYLKAGADIITTNTFGANTVSQADYGTGEYVYEMNLESARIAKKCAEKAGSENPCKKRFVAGSVGPTNKSSSIPVVPDKPHKREILFEKLAGSYESQIEGLIDGGVDILLIETIFDTLNAKAAIFAAENIFKKLNKRVPVIITFSLDTLGKRILSGQAPEAFLASVSHASPVAAGLNCTGEGSLLRGPMSEIAGRSPWFTIFYPNAGFPDTQGRYTQDEEEYSKGIRPLLESGSVNIIGGCCGTKPSHIEKLAELAVQYKPREAKKGLTLNKLSGLETVDSKSGSYLIAGEKTNTSGSKGFAKSISEKDYEKGVRIARKQVESGAHILDVCVDDPLVDGREAIRKIIFSLGADPVTSRVPVMIDSSDFHTAEEGLRSFQGKGIVNSITLKEGEADFLEKASLVKQYGAAVVVMPIDEKGQAGSFERKREIVLRAYRLLTEKLDFNPEDILFDLNVMAVGTGVDTGENVAASIIDTCRWIKGNLPGAGTVAGVSNLSFSFRGNNEIRNALHAVLLEHLEKEGLDIAIVNPAELKTVSDFSRDLIELCENLLFSPSDKALNDLMEWNGKESGPKREKGDQSLWRQLPAEERLEHSILHGITVHLAEDLDELCSYYEDPIDIIHGPLINAMKTIGTQFEEGHIFLPQIIRSAGIMKKAVEHLKPRFPRDKSASGNNDGKKILLATVEGDVHDIGKNIAKLVLSCYGYNITDLGIMVPAEEIVKRAVEENADLIGLSGLITPSLEKMGDVARKLEERKLSIPLVVGGAATSKRYTALKLAPLYSHPVVHVPDVSGAPVVARKLIYKEKYPDFAEKIRKNYMSIKETTR